MGVYKEASERTVVGVSKRHVDDFVFVSESMFLKGKGLKGYVLFANKTFEKGRIIIEYVGKLLTDRQAETKKRYKQYMFDVKSNGKVIFVIDGANSKYASAAKFVNTTEIFFDKHRNAEFVQYNQKIYLKASSKIKEGDEIIAFYGPDTHKIINRL